MRTLLWFLFNLIAAASLADTRGIEIVAAEGESIGRYTESHALLIGVSDYRSGWPDLEGVPAEMRTVRTALEAQGFDIRQINDPDEAQLRLAFQQFMDDFGYERSARLLIFYSGHGFTRENGSKGYLVPADAPSPLTDEVGFLRRAYPMTDLIALARNIEATHVLFLFDSCFSGTIFKTRALPEAPRLIDRLTTLPVRQFITAGSAGEEVPARSVFTPAFVDALEFGLGDLNGDGYITGSELGMYLQQRVAEHSEQTPQFGKINDYELSRGDFVFASARKVAPIVAKPEPPPALVERARIAPPSSLDRLEAALGEIATEREDRERKLAAMRTAYARVAEFERQPGVSRQQIASAWKQFLELFPEDDPDSRDDDAMRQGAAGRSVPGGGTRDTPPSSEDLNAVLTIVDSMFQ